MLYYSTPYPNPQGSTCQHTLQIKHEEKHSCKHIKLEKSSGCSRGRWILWKQRFPSMWQIFFNAPHTSGTIDNLFLFYPSSEHCCLLTHMCRNVLRQVKIRSFPSRTSIFSGAQTEHRPHVAGRHLQPPRGRQAAILAIYNSSQLGRWCCARQAWSRWWWSARRALQRSSSPKEQQVTTCVQEAHNNLLIIQHMWTKRKGAECFFVFF